MFTKHCWQINQKAKHATDNTFYLLNTLCKCFAKLHNLTNNNTNNNECLIYVILLLLIKLLHVLINAYLKHLQNKHLSNYLIHVYYMIHSILPYFI